MTKIAGNEFDLSGWHVDPSACAISRDQEVARLEPKAMDLLVFMASRQGSVLSRDELLAGVWKGAVVTDESLTNAIIKLRKAFNDDARHPRFIETVPKRGYRLVAEVSATEQQAEQPTEQAVGQRPYPPVTRDDAPQQPPVGTAPSGNRFPVAVLVGVLLVLVVAAAVLLMLPETVEEPEGPQQILELPDKPSIAVLPFVNVGNKAEYSYFSDGLTDDLINDLSRLSGLFVISRNSTFQYKGRAVDVRTVSAALGVRYILEGSVRRSEDQVRVNTQLIDGQSGIQLWAERYDGELHNVFDLQDQITAKIISALSLRLTDSEQQQMAMGETVNPQAYDEFLKGWEHRWRVSRDDYAIAEKHFLKALEIDPTYARARAALALIYWSTWKYYWHVNSEYQFAGWARAQHQLDASADTPSTLAYSLRSAMQLYRQRFESAISEARAAIALNPSDPTGYLALADVLSYTGKVKEAIEQARKGLRLDPNFPSPYLQVEGRALFDSGNYQQAVQLLVRAIDANPVDTEPMIVATAAYAYLGETEMARAMLDRLNARLREDMRAELTLDTSGKDRWPYSDPKQLKHLREGLELAGVPAW